MVTAVGKDTWIEVDGLRIQYTMDYYITFLAHLLDALHLERVRLVGLSMGGGIALGFPRAS